MEWGILLKMKNKPKGIGSSFKNKIILPIKNKKDEVLSKIYVSITDRIAINYFRLLIINGILFFAIFIALYVNVHIGRYSSLAEKNIVALETSSGNISMDSDINPYKDRGIYMVIYEKSGKGQEAEVYRDLEYDVSSFASIFGIIYLSSDKSCKMTARENIEFIKGSREYKAVFYYNMTVDYYSLWQLFWQLVLLYTTIIIFIIREGKSDNIKMLAPIKEMTETANRLTMLNLHNERLNVKGMKNELKELAEVFNEMLDRMESSYESQKKFVSDASHELRTPIAIVQGYAGMLNRWGARDPEVLQESIEALQNEAKMMQDLVEKLLFLSRHDKKTLKLNKELFNMKPVVEDMVKETKMVVSDRIIECPYVDDVNVYGDKQSLKQAIRVLIENAVKYSADGDKVIISCRNINGDCIIGVEDTGIGMTEKDMEHIFNRFYRSDDVRNRKIDGHGLGLSIAKLIIMAHAGKIHIRSQFTVGTRFLVTLPRPRR